MKKITFTKKRLLYVALLVVLIVGGGALVLTFMGDQPEPLPPPPQAAQSTPAPVAPAADTLPPVETDAAFTPIPQTAFENNVLELDPVTLQKINVRTAPVAIEPLSRAIRTTGRFEMDEQGIHTVSLKIDGWVERLYADFDGAIVQKGQPLLELYSPKLVTTQEEYLLALKNVRRLSGGAAESDARHLLDAARRRLAYWDLSEDQIRRLEETGVPERTLTFYAPAPGEVMRRNVAEGQHITAGQALMDIVDISRIWLIVDVYEQDLPWVKVGTRARVELPAQPDQVFTGRVDYIYHMMNSELRTARVRIVLPGRHGGPLKPGMYATAYLEGRARGPAPVVPESAVIRTGQRELVLVALGGGRFRPQLVKAGYASGGKVQVLSGLEEGEQVVTSAQFLLDSEAQLRGVIASMAADSVGASAQAGPNQ
ncbi:MAG: efflux RND transporter periplasmic adaptor subunit [Rhodothermales bacterium]